MEYFVTLFYKTFTKTMREFFVSKKCHHFFIAPRSLLPIYCSLKKISEVFLKLLPINGKSTLECLSPTPTSEIWGKKKSKQNKTRKTNYSPS